MLTAIAIPVFTSQLEKSRESTDAANIRSRYAEAVVQILEDPTNVSIDAVEMRQQQAGWQNDQVEDSMDALATGAATPVNGDLHVTVTGTPSGTTGATTTFAFTPGSDSANPLLAITIG